MKKIFSILGLFLVSVQAFPCSFPPGYKAFLMAPSIYGKETAPEPPKVKIEKIERGRKGDPGMCADAGTLVLKIENYSVNTGYLFTIESGEVEDQIFPDKYIAPTPGSREIRFVWLDGAYAFQEPIDIKVRVVAVSLSGSESKPSYIQVSHPGRSGHR